MASLNSLEEALPGRLSLSIRCGIDTMSFQDASYAGIGDQVAEVG